MTYKEIPIETIKALLTYDPKTGRIFWNERPASMFPSGHRTSQGNANNWNSTYAGTPALNAPKRKGYLAGCILGCRVLAHRVVWAMFHGYWPKNDIDHINGVTSDNRIENLRDVSNAENHRNVKLQSNNQSGASGVRYVEQTGRWQARIKFNGQEIHIGMFDSFADAKRARKQREAELGFHPNHGRANEVLRPPLGMNA